jgi:CHAD domain-containing protein
VGSNYSDIIKKSTHTVETVLGRIHKKGEAALVHEFRLSVKKLRALLPAMDATLPPQLDRIFRSSGRVRDLDVQRPLIRRALGTQGLADEDLDDFLRNRRRKARKRLRRLTRAVDTAWLAGEMKDLRRRADRLQKGLDDSVRTLASKRRAELIALSNALVDSERIHAFRIKLKELSYLNRALPPDAQLRTNLEQIGELLGQWHDCVNAEKTIQRFLRKKPRASCGRILGVLSEWKAQLFASAMKKPEEANHV